MRPAGRPVPTFFRRPGPAALPPRDRSRVALALLAVAAARRLAAALRPGLALRLLAPALLLALATPARAGDVIYIGQPTHWLQVQDTFVRGPVYDTPQEALERAADGDTIILLQDVDEPLVIERSISLLGYGQRTRPRISATVTVRANGVLIDQVHFLGVNGAAVLVDGARDVAITRCFITECDQGIELRESTACRLEANRLLFAGLSIFVRGGSGHLIRRNSVDSGGFYAVTIEGSPNNRLIDNVIRRSGWTGVLLHSLSSGTELVGNVIEGSDVGVSIQTNGNVLRENLFAASHHGLLLGRSPLGKDGTVHETIAYIDSPTGDTNLISSGNRIEDNVFRNCKRDAVLLKQAEENTVSGNRITGGGSHGIVLMAAADRNLVSGNTIGPHPRSAVCIVGSRGNRVVDNIIAEGTPVRLVDAADNEIANPLVQSLAAGELVRERQLLPDGSGAAIAWGDFHTHSLLSDGASTPEELLTYARDVVDLDFVALSDHGEYVGHGDGRWERLNELTRDFSVPGQFVAIPGFETTFAMGWSGHYNVYFAGPSGQPYMAPHGGKAWIPNLETLSPVQLLHHLRADGEDTIVIRHHYWSTPRYWRESPRDDDILPMTEICSVHGIWTGDRDVDTYKSDRTAEVRGHAGTMRGGLRDGRMFAVGGGSDTHYSFPTDSAAVAVLTDELIPQAIFAAIRKRATYATTGARIGLAFRMDGQPMGSALTTAGTPTAEVWVEGTAELEEVLLFENETIAHRGKVEAGERSHVSHFTWTPAGPPADGTYYQVRVRQADGELAWSTPIWVRPVAPTIAPPGVFADRERVALLVYAAVLRAWPDLSCPELLGQTPRAALQDAALSVRARELWPRWLETAHQINALAVEHGLVDRALATHLIKEYAWRFGALPPPIRVEPVVDPLVDVAAMAEMLGF